MKIVALPSKLFVFSHTQLESDLFHKCAQSVCHQSYAWLLLNLARLLSGVMLAVPFELDCRVMSHALLYFNLSNTQ